ncbi:hypothetical protein GCM10027168_16420 [Streptomyces capparidis]
MTRTSRRLSLLPPAAAAFALLLTAACGADSDGGGQDGARKPSAGAGSSAPAEADRAPAAEPATLEQLASAIGCDADVVVDAEELRQGACTTGEGKYRLLTFAEDAGQAAYLAEARDYGGTYLVGERWLVTAQPSSSLTALRTELGGRIEEGASHDGHPGGGQAAASGAGRAGEHGSEHPGHGGG